MTLRLQIAFAMLSLLVYGIARADLTHPLYAAGRNGYLVGDYATACPNMTAYLQQDAIFLSRPENVKVRQSIEQVVAYCYANSRPALSPNDMRLSGSPATPSPCGSGQRCETGSAVGGGVPPR